MNSHVNLMLKAWKQALILNAEFENAHVDFEIIEACDFGNGIIREISRLFKSSSNLKGAKLFAGNNRRAADTLLIIKVNKTIVSAQSGINGNWQSKYER